MEAGLGAEGLLILQRKQGPVPHQALVAVLGLQGVPVLGIPVGHGVLLRLLKAQ